jgi:enamine deaminase RidA (YjgF/YER057c/UK114 family)
MGLVQQLTGMCLLTTTLAHTIIAALETSQTILTATSVTSQTILTATSVTSQIIATEAITTPLTKTSRSKYDVPPRNGA